MKRTVIAIAAGLAISGGVFASAASLGGVNSNALGSSTTVVASCDSDGVNLDYTTTWDAESGTYRVREVTLDGIADSCKGQDVEVSLKSDRGDSTTTERTAVTGSTQTIKVADFPGESVEGAAILIAG